MSTCGEMTRERKRPRSLYLEPRASGPLDVLVKGDVHHPTGYYGVEIGGFRAPSVIPADRLERRVEDAKAQGCFGFFALGVTPTSRRCGQKGMGVKNRSVRGDSERLLAAGWEPRIRGGLIVWRRPDGRGSWYSREVAVEVLEALETSRNRTARREQEGPDTAVGEAAKGGAREDRPRGAEKRRGR